MGSMRPTLTVSSAIAFAEANARTARAVSALHMNVSSNLFDISVAHGGSSPLLVPARSRDRRASHPRGLSPYSNGAVDFSPSFHQRDDPRWACVAALDLQGQRDQHELVRSNLRKIGHKLNQGNTLFEQGKVVCDPDFTGVELHAPPKRLFRKDIHRYRRHAFACQQRSHACLQIGQQALRAAKALKMLQDISSNRRMSCLYRADS